MRDTRIFEFGGYKLDPVRRLLFDATGATVPLNARAFDTLLCFLEQPGGLLTKQTLMKAIWPNSIVEENNLSQSILAVRRALGETPGEHRFIVTEMGRGYRFVAPVQQFEFATAAGVSFADDLPEERASSADTPAGPFAWWFTRLVVPALCVTALLFAQFAERPGDIAAPVSIAVLPFIDLSANHAQQFLADGIADELLLRLADLPELKVVARTASFDIGSRMQDPRSIGRALRVNRLLEASVRAAGSQLRVSVQILETGNGAMLWSRNYDRQLGDSGELEKELARTIAHDVATQLASP